jgi:hypothetical protein
MPVRGVIFDLFHTLTAPESEGAAALPWTSDYLDLRVLAIAADRSI